MAVIGNMFKIEHFLKRDQLQPVFNYLKTALDPGSAIYKRIMDYPVGAFVKFDISDEFFALEQVFYTKDRKDCFIESHREYVDFQLVVSGIEQMEYVDIDKLEIAQSYDQNTDLIVYKLLDTTSKIVLQSGDLAVYFPEDGHIGMPKYDASELVHKTVVKVPIKYF